MRENPSLDIASLDKTPQFAPSEKSGEGIFIPVSVKFYFVTALMWLLLIGLCATSWVGAWVLGVKAASLLAVSLIRPSHGSPTAGTDDGKGSFTADMAYLKQHTKNGGEIGVPIFFRSSEFDAALDRIGGEVVSGVGGVSHVEIPGRKAEGRTVQNRILPGNGRAVRGIGGNGSLEGRIGQVRRDNGIHAQATQETQAQGKEAGSRYRVFPAKSGRVDKPAIRNEVIE